MNSRGKAFATRLILWENEVEIKGRALEFVANAVALTMVDLKEQLQTLAMSADDKECLENDLKFFERIAKQVEKAIDAEEKVIADFIAEESPHHPQGYLTREKAIQFMKQREFNGSMAPGINRPRYSEKQMRDALRYERYK